MYGCNPWASRELAPEQFRVQSARMDLPLWLLASIAMIWILSLLSLAMSLPLEHSWRLESNIAAEKKNNPQAQNSLT